MYPFLECPKLRLVQLFEGPGVSEMVASISNLCCRVRLRRKHPLYVNILGVE